jgi:DNA-binding transcriptional ArsR family regulator
LPRGFTTPIVRPSELSHRFILAGERPRGLKEETGQGTKALREMISSGRLAKVVTISTPDGPETKLINQPGPIAYAESTTATELFEEDANRCLILASDEGPEQTRRVLRAHGQRSAGEISQADQEARRDELRALHLLLEPQRVVVPFAPAMAELFPCERVEARRAFGHLETLIQTLALLSQYQRPCDSQNRVIALPGDHAFARQLLEPIFARSLGARESGALQTFVARLQRLSGEYTAEQLARHLKLSERTIREHLKVLTARDLVEQTQAPRGPVPARWLIRTPFQLTDDEESRLTEKARALARVCRLS